MKKPVICFTIADEKNMPITRRMINSLRKFHSEKELPLVIVGGDDLSQRLEKDRSFFYRSTPVIARELIKEYEYVLKLDGDQLILGSLDFILSRRDFDVGTVSNYNRIDPPKYGLVTCAGIPPEMYYNAGLVAMRSEEFISHWHNLCFSPFFNNLQYREQDLLNIMCHFGTWKVRHFDQYDPVYDYTAWHGLAAKGEGLKMKLVDGKVMLPKAEDGYPNRDVEIKVYHFAGGGNESKNYRLCFDEELIKHIDWLVSNGK